VETKVVFNNTEDIKQYKSVIEELKSAVNKNDLQEALRVNGNITDKNLKFEIAFFDRNYVVNLKLKKPHVLSADGYIEKWKANADDRSAVLFLFVKEYGKTDYEFKGLFVSDQLANQHLFEEVVAFINEHLSGSNKTVVANGSKYLAKAITPVWTDEKRQKAEAMLEMDKYKKYHYNFFHNTWDPQLLDLDPTTEDLPSTYAKVILTKDGITNLEPAIPIYVDKLEFANRISLLDPNTNQELDVWPVTYLTDNSGIERARLTCSAAFYDLIEKLNAANITGNIPVSQWGWDIQKNFSFTGRPPTSSDKFILTMKSAKSVLKDGDVKPPWDANYAATYCNLFAYDLSLDILFSHSPWGSSHCANKLHWRISHDNNFKKVSFTKNEDKPQKKDAWEYTQAGYVVYFTAFGPGINEDKLESVTAEKDIVCDSPGHIATCYRDGKVIQAGASVKILIWNTAQRAHVYLGYIIKD